MPTIHPHLSGYEVVVPAEIRNSSAFAAFTNKYGHVFQKDVVYPQTVRDKDRHALIDTVLDSFQNQGRMFDLMTLIQAVDRRRSWMAEWHNDKTAPDDSINILFVEWDILRAFLTINEKSKDLATALQKWFFMYLPQYVMVPNPTYSAEGTIRLHPLSKLSEAMGEMIIPIHRDSEGNFLIEESVNEFFTEH